MKRFAYIISIIFVIILVAAYYIMNYFIPDLIVELAEDSHKTLW